MSADRIVYSTNPRPEPTCLKCGEAPCVCAPVEVPPNKQTARIEHDRKRRRGKVVTVISGLVLSESKLTELAKTLKNRCGAGGTVKDSEIEIQGEHRDKIAQWLQEMGYRTKFVGGR